MSKPTINVSAALIFDEQNRILISRRPQGTHLAGYWEFPGGRIESGESAQEALIREIKEELALDIQVGQLYLQETFEYDIKNVDIAFYLCSQTDKHQQPQAIEVAEWKWVSLGELEQYQFPPADQALIRELTEYNFMICNR